jgi:prefoldin subunit 5
LDWGVNNTSIGIQDLAGVSLAAVKELDTQLQQKSAEAERLKDEVKQLRENQLSLEKRLAAIEELLRKNNR